MRALADPEANSNLSPDTRAHRSAAEAGDDGPSHQSLLCGMRSRSAPLAPEDHDNPDTHYCIIRRDLSLGLMAANIQHAAGETGPAHEHVHAVTLMAKDEVSLRAMAARFDKLGKRYHPIIECDGAHAGQMMAIGFWIMKKKEGRFLSGIPLLK